MTANRRHTGLPLGRNGTACSRRGAGSQSCAGDSQLPALWSWLRPVWQRCRYTMACSKLACAIAALLVLGLPPVYFCFPTSTLGMPKCPPRSDRESRSTGPAILTTVSDFGSTMVRVPFRSQIAAIRREWLCVTKRASIFRLEHRQRPAPPREICTPTRASMGTESPRFRSRLNVSPTAGNSRGNCARPAEL